MVKRENNRAVDGTKKQEAKLRELVGQYKNMPGALIPVLQKAQELYGYLPIEVLKVVADGLNLPLAQVAGVASFYTFFKNEKCGKYLIRMCKNAPCHVKEAATTLKALEASLGIKVGETTPDGKFTLETCDCLGICERAPAVMVNNEVFGPLLSKDVAQFLVNFE